MTSAVWLHLCTQSFWFLFFFFFSYSIASDYLGIKETFLHQEREVILPMSFETRSEN